MKSIVKIILTFIFFLSLHSVAQAQGAHPGTDLGMPTPVDGGLLMGLLAIGGVAFGLLKKKK